MINDGYRVTNLELGPVGIPFVRGGDIGDDGSICTGVADHISPEFRDRVQSKLTRPGDVAFISKGTVGRVGFIREGQPAVVLSPQVCFWRSTDSNSIDPRFLFYLLKSNAFQASLDAVKTQGSMAADYVSLSDQRQFRLSLPPIEEQRAIGNLLGCLDDKCNLNRQMSATLEATARAVFRSWFVDFDPVRAKVDGRQPDGMDAATACLFPEEFEDSALGSMPKGWRVGKLGEVATNLRRGVDADDVEPGTAYLGLEHMPRKSIGLSDWETHPDIESNKFRFRRGEILFGKLRPYFHKVGVAPVDGICSTDILVVAPKTPDWFGFALFHFSSDELVQHADSASTGTKMPRTNWTDLAAFKVVLPDEMVVRRFNAIVQAMVSKMIAGIAESRNLAAIRDALLPKLLSGEIRVGSSIEEQAPRVQVMSRPERLKLDEIGYWSEIKLDIIREYAKPYSTILSAQKKPPLYHVYIDAFAGAGVHLSKGSGEEIPGSPQIAGNTDPPFREYHFIDLNGLKVENLRTMFAGRPNVCIYEGDCNEVMLDQVLPRVRYEDYRRGLCLLDPYGLHLNWEVICRAGQMKTLDIFLNFPIADMNRNVFWRNPEGVDESDIQRMNAFWGDDSWRRAAYKVQQTLFGPVDEKTDNDTIAEAFRERLRTVAGFSNVPEPMPMRNTKGAIVYYLFFASAKPVAQHIVSHLFNKYRNRGAE